MTVLFYEDFSSPPAYGVGGNWSAISPPEGHPAAPYASGGTFHLVVPTGSLYTTSQITSYDNQRLICSQWTVNLADIPTALITSTTEDSFAFTFSLQSTAGTVYWSIRYVPPDVPPPEPSGSDTTIVAYPGLFTNYPPVASTEVGPETNFDMATHKYLRISDHCRRIVWEYSGDGVTWTEAHSWDLSPEFTLANGWALSLGAHAVYDLVVDAQIDEVTGETIDGCTCSFDCDYFDGDSLGSDWVDDGPILFQGDDWVRAGQFLDDGAWQVDENNTAGEFNVAMGSIRHAADACADQFIEAVVGNFFQGHDGSVDEWFQWVEGDVWLFAQLSPGSDVGIGAHFIIHVSNTGDLHDGEAFVEFFTTDEDGEVTFTDNYGNYAPLTGWQANPDYTIRFEVSAAGHLKAYFGSYLLAEDDVTPAGGRHVGIGMQWNRTSYPIGDPPNPGTSFQVKSVCTSLCLPTGGWRVGRVAHGNSPW